MTTEELLKPRYKVIAEYPQSYLKVGDIFEADNVTKFMANYPHLFKPLAWWEERKVEDMPEYVKYRNKVWQVNWEIWLAEFKPRYTKESNRTDSDLALSWHYNSADFLPATLTEYSDYITHSLPNQGRGK